MPDWVIQSKLAPSMPSRSWMPRERLVRGLDRALRVRAAVLHAPAGCGKTSLLSDWRQTLIERDIPVAWLSLDENDRDLFQFLTYLVAVLRSCGLVAGAGVLPPPSGTAGAPAATMIGAVLTELAKCSATGVLILDDFHRAESPETCQAVNRCFARLPPDLHLVLSTREYPAALSLADLRARENLLVLDQAALHFSEPEIDAWLGGQIDERAPDDWAAQLHARTEGWPIALSTVRRWLTGGMSAVETLDQLSGRSSDLSDYFLEQVFEGLAARSAARGQGEIGSELTIMRSLLNRYADRDISGGEVDRLERLGESLDHDNDLMHAVRCNLLCVMHAQRGDFDACMAAGDKAIRHFRAMGSVFGETFIYFHEGYACMEQGRLRDAEVLYGAGRDLELDFLSRNGQAGAARFEAVTGSQRGVADHLALHRLRSSVRARSWLHSGEVDRAAALLDNERSHSRERGLIRSLVTHSVLLAVARWEEGAHDDAVVAFEAALAPSLFEGIKRPFVDEGEALVEVIGDLTRASESRRGNRLRDRFLAELTMEIGAAAPGPVHGHDELTPREREILRYLVQGRSNREIAEAIPISVNTVKFHLKNVFGKLGVTTRKDAVSASIRRRHV